MRFEPALTRGILVRRYKRFLADIDLPGGERTTVHCPNTGAMLGCREPGLEVGLSRSDNQRRKYPLTWEVVRAARAGGWVGIHSAAANGLVAEALDAGRIESLTGYEILRREVPYGANRFDCVLSGEGRRDCVVEVKSVTAAVAGGVALFPDARSTRGARHALELAERVRAGDRAVMLYCVQRGDVERVRPADEIDPDYGRAIRLARDAGVEMYAYACEVSPEGIELSVALAVDLTDP